MPWKNRTPSQRQEALIGANSVVKRNFKLTFSVAERQLLEQIALSDGNSPYFKPIEIVSDADWLVNHDELGQTYESFWRSYIIGKPEPSTCLNDGGQDSRPQTAFSMRTQLRSRAASRTVAGEPKVISILPLGLFPGDDQPSTSKSSNTFLIWLQTYCKAFFHKSKVVVLPPVTVAEVACRYRVNQLTGRFQLHAGDILVHLRKVKPKYAHCLVAVTMVDLYPKSSWDFVFGLASSSHAASAGGVGVFSFARFDDVFYETWTQGTDKVIKTEDGKLSYTVFLKPAKRADGSEVPITDALLRRACNVMAHEIGHMFGLKHCVWMSCLMNGSNHLQESDNRPCHLCPVCLRKLQSVMDFNLLDRYRALREWMSVDFWKNYIHDPNQVVVEPEKRSPRGPLSSSFGRRTSLPEALRTSVTSQSRRPATKKGGRSSGRISSSARIPASTSVSLFSDKGIAPTKNDVKRKEKHAVQPPPLLSFAQFRNWLRDVIGFLSVQNE